jgi:hypothetical protein
MQQRGLRERMMKHKHMTLVAVVAITILILTACGSDLDDVATLKTTENTQVEATADAADPILDNEAMMMAFTECMREQGIDVMDPAVDADGNVGKPEFVEGMEYDKETIGAVWEACEHHLEGFTWEKERVDMSEVVDEYVVLAACLREKGYDVDDPTAETLDEWGDDFKRAINWDDPGAVADYEECSGETVGEGGGK